MGQISLATMVELPPVRALEIGLTGRAEAQFGASGRENLTGSVAESQPLSLTVERELAALWRIRVPSGTRRGSIRTSFQVVSGSGVPGRLSNADLPQEEIPVTVVGSGPAVVETDGQSTVLEGGAILLLDLSQVRHAGRYEGTVQMTVDNL